MGEHPHIADVLAGSTLEVRRPGANELKESPMHAIARPLAIVAVTAASITGLSACALLPHKTYEDSAIVTEEVTSVRIDAESGSVTIRGVEGLDEVTVERELRYRFSLPSEDSHRVVRGELILEDCGRQCSVSYVVEVPTGTPVSGVTTNGSIDLAGLGEIDVRTSNGRISLDDIDGSISARTSNGRIEGERLTGGAIEVRTSNGAIEIRSDGEHDVTASTSNGSITVVVPDGDYRIDMETSNGRTESELGDDPGADVRLDLQTSNGSITVERD